MLKINPLKLKKNFTPERRGKIARRWITEEMKMCPNRSTENLQNGIKTHLNLSDSFYKMINRIYGSETVNRLLCTHNDFCHYGLQKELKSTVLTGKFSRENIPPRPEGWTFN